MNSLSILVADDEEDILVLLEHWLTSEGHTVLKARNGTEALKLAQARHIDLAVTDVLMPDGDGLTVIDGLRKSHPEARVLAISGGGRYMNSEEYLKIAQGFGASAAIMKPFTRDQFLQSVNRLMAKRSAPKT